MEAITNNTANDNTQPQQRHRRPRKRKLHTIFLRGRRLMKYLVDGPEELEQDPTKIHASTLPVVFAFHGLFMSCKSVIQKKRLLAARDEYVVVAVNRAGYHGSSPVDPSAKDKDPNKFSYSYTEFALDVKELADLLDIDQFVTVGHSSGGPNALACAAILGPDRVRAVGTLGSDPEYAQIDDHKSTVVIDCCMGTWLPRCLGVLVPCLKVANGIRNDYILEREPYPFETESIVQRALVVAGEADNIIPVALTKRIHDRLPNSRFEVVPGATHEDLISDAVLDKTFRSVLRMGGLLLEGEEETEEQQHQQQQIQQQQQNNDTNEESSNEPSKLSDDKNNSASPLAAMEGNIVSPAAQFVGAEWAEC
uniref:AB hydrolase-1 domain-containing protein n=1 Tax=Pseudo-nitzschia australis TaxID=44445 RepID=A0A7S4EEL2_9STRA